MHAAGATRLAGRLRARNNGAEAAAGEGKNEQPRFLNQKPERRAIVQQAVSRNSGEVFPRESGSAAVASSVPRRSEATTARN